MTQICLVFQVHQPYRLRNFHFFEIGAHHPKFDEKKNVSLLRQVAKNSYLPMNTLLQHLMEQHGDRIKISLAISGTVLDQMETYMPETLKSFQSLVATGNVELLGQPYGGSLSAIKSFNAFEEEVIAHKKRVWALFKKRPVTFFNTGLIYLDDLGNRISEMGYKATVVGGNAMNGIKNPNALYDGNTSKPLKLFLRNASLSDDIALRFSQTNWCEWPLTSEKYMGWLEALPSEDSLVTLVMDYATFGEKHGPDTGIFDFIACLLKGLAIKGEFRLTIPKEVLQSEKVRSKLSIPGPVAWSGTPNGLSAWTGNDLQEEAIERLYAVENDLRTLKDSALLKDWEYLKSADHFLFMEGNNGYNPYGGPYDAFLRYMNVLSDFEVKIQTLYKAKHPIKKNNNAKRQKVT